MADKSGGLPPLCGGGKRGPRRKTAAGISRRGDMTFVVIPGERPGRSTGGETRDPRETHGCRSGSRIAPLRACLTAGCGRVRDDRLCKPNRTTSQSASPRQRGRLGLTPDRTTTNSSGRTGPRRLPPAIARPGRSSRPTWRRC